MKCKYFDSCSAPICPLDPDSMKHAIWYPDEEICRNEEFKDLLWIENMRKIKEAIKILKNANFYFTVEMLDRKLVIDSKVKGIDPDSKNTDKQEADWGKAL